MNITDDLLEEVKRKLNITWESENTDNRVKDVINTVSSVLSRRLGLDVDYDFYEGDKEAFSLFLNACLYEFSDALDDFQINYAADIMACRKLLEALAEETEQDESEQ